MAYETLMLTREERFAVVTLNRPPANAISAELVRDLDAAMEELARLGHGEWRRAGSFWVLVPARGERAWSG